MRLVRREELDDLVDLARLPVERRQTEERERSPGARSTAFFAKPIARLARLVLRVGRVEPLERDVRRRRTSAVHGRVRELLDLLDHLLFVRAPP